MMLRHRNVTIYVLMRKFAVNLPAKPRFLFIMATACIGSIAVPGISHVLVVNVSISSMHRCQHGLKKMRDARFSSLRTSVDAHTQTKNICMFASNGNMWCSHDQVSINYLVARC